MLKIAGMIFLLCGGTGIGCYLAQGCKFRLEAMWELRQKLQLLSGEIAYSSNDLQHILERFGQNGDFWSPFWREISEGLQQRMGPSFSEIWESSIKHHLVQYWWKEEDYRYLYQLGKNLGGMDRDSQLKALQLYSERLALMLERQQNSVQEKTKIYRLLGFAGGAVVSLVLL